MIPAQTPLPEELNNIAALPQSPVNYNPDLFKLNPDIAESIAENAHLTLYGLRMGIITNHTINFELLSLTDGSVNIRLAGINLLQQFSTSIHVTKGLNKISLPVTAALLPGLYGFNLQLNGNTLSKNILVN